MASTYLSRTPSNAYYLKATFSFWFKRSGLGEMGLFGRKGSNATNNLSTCHFGSDDTLLINFRDSSGTSQYYQITNRKFRDTNGWYHFHYIIEGDNSTQGDRSRLYINGVRETSFSLNNNPSSNSYQIATFLSSDGAFTVGRALRSQTDTFGNFDGLISHFHCSTGYAYEPTVFGETDATTGEWKIKTSPTFTPGTDGFTILKDGNTITDQSANSNNFSLTAGTLTNMKDCPSNVFATFNNLEYYGSDGATLSNTNTTYASPSAGHRYLRSTIGVSTGKYYAEFKLAVSAGSGTNMVGITDHEMNDGTDELSQDNYSYAYVDDGSVRANGSNVDTGEATYAANDIIMVAMDITNSKLYFGKNGTWINSGDPTSGSTGTGAYSIQPVASTLTGCYHFAAGDWVNPGTNTWSANFGNGYFGTTAVASAGTNASNNGVFEYDVPAGYTALSTKGLNK